MAIFFSPIKERGFSLLEVLVAFVVLTLIGTALFRLFGGALNNVDAADAWSRAAQVAQNQLALAEQLQPLHETSASGTDGNVRWELMVSPYELPPDVGGGMSAPNSMQYKLFRLQVTVYFPGVARKERTLTLDTMKVGQLGLPGQ